MSGFSNRATDSGEHVLALSAKNNSKNYGAVSVGIFVAGTEQEIEMNFHGMVETSVHGIAVLKV